jgi:hypothetical protein
VGLGGAAGVGAAVEVGELVIFGLGDIVAEGFGAPSLITTPVFQTSFLPFLIQVYFLPL